MSAVRVGRAPTVNAGRYLQQLCKHWSHKFVVEFDAKSGVIGLPAGKVGLTAFPDHLEARLTTDAPDDLDRLQKVVTEHLDRFAFREAPLPFAWGENGGGA